MKPLLVIITGKIAAGKTTLSRKLAEKIGCPLVSRDAIKEGYLNSIGVCNDPADGAPDLLVYDIFFETISLLIARGVTVIAEAAFQDKLWRPKLVGFLEQARVRVIICETSPVLIAARFAQRLRENPARERFHGDASLQLSNTRFASLTENYKPVSIDAPTLWVDTTDGYDPHMESIIEFIWQGNLPANLSP